MTSTGMADEPTALAALETPCLVLDLARLDANAGAMAGRVAGLGVRLRPHVKTHKSIDVARRVAALSPHGGITVSTLEELRRFADAGFGDIMYAVGIVPQKLDAVAAVMAQGTRVSCILDNRDAARALVERGRALGVAFRVWLEVDTDGHRAGLAPDGEDLLACGRILAEGGALLEGVMTHAGESYNCSGIEAIRELAEQERRLCVEAALRLRAAGLPCAGVSVGSTPTITFARHLEGVTEARVGVYAFQDLVMAGLGVCRPEDVALTVLATVIGHQASRNWIIVDAGWMAMSRDRGTAGQSCDQGYGLVADAAGRLIDDLIVLSANQEHGIVGDRHGRPLDLARHPIGSRLRILPNHACATAAQHACYVAVEGDAIVAEWPIIRGW